ncbi:MULTISPECIES: disulfide bond formation protein DsbD [unclassified Sporosarcina]|uniref:disulfide bond formation protein DsbD n=1 Tax=unclassified Sporosarcina TaxID=2647733 RepID=UPI000C166BA4|nr:MULTISPECIES: disulfide bond formation protein DsbD [unclassified Sporosarcina]PID06464.1 disulfide bond formation protein DsbD [Sporosarcina sp. P30]PID09658.1 disulfide bond formation protein DsbD [Sporosarcina sp. P31]PID13236.1 disulfide bond formation protein DsbD [Sporosarcina sp. P32b]
MNKKLFNTMGWILLLGIGVFWIAFGYTGWFLLLLPLTTLFFSISDGSISKMKNIKKIKVSQIILILIAFIIAVGIVFGLIQLANILINDVLGLTGWIKTLSQFIAIILSLIPIQLAFGSVIYKVIGDVSSTKV